MVRSLSSLRAHVKKEKDDRQSGFIKDHALYPHWILPFGGTSLVRLLPDGNPEAETFWSIQKLIPMVFSDPEGGTPLYFNAPCMEMYDRKRKCPVLAPVRALYALAKKLTTEGKPTEAKIIEANATAHWIDFSFWYNTLVLKSGFVEQDLPDDLSPIRNLKITKQIQYVIEASLGLAQEKFDNNGKPIKAEAPISDFADDELPCGTFDMVDVERVVKGEVNPDEAEAVLERFKGYPLLLSKQKQGDHPDWRGSKFLTREAHELSDDDLAAIHKFGLPNLNDRLPKRPTDEQYELYVEMIKVSIEHGDWDKSWEEAGVRPFRKKSDAAEGSDSTGGASRSNSITDRIKNNTARARGSEASEGLSTVLNRRRAATAVAEEAVNKTAVEEPAEPAAATTEASAEAAERPATDAASASKLLAEKLKAQYGKK